MGRMVISGGSPWLAAILGGIAVMGCESVNEPPPISQSPYTQASSPRQTQTQTGYRNLPPEGGAAEAENAGPQSATATMAHDGDMASGMDTGTTAPRMMDGTSAMADLPPAEPGQCFARILIPARYETVREQVLASEATERLEVEPARYEWGEERVLIAEAGERIEVVPATYRTVTETVTVEPERLEVRTVPAQYETRSERVLVREGYTAWRKGEGLIGDEMYGGTVTDVRGTPTGEIMCLIEVPPEYDTVEREVMVAPARTERVRVPAVTRTVTKRVVDTPATTRTVAIPAQYETVRVRREVAPASERRVPVPARYETVSRERKVGDEQLVWREVLCETNTTPDVIRRVQTALRREGYNVAVDGVAGPSTMQAVTAYQRRENLGTGGLTMATVRSLGVM